MRILHTSDWHLGRQFHQVSLLEDQRHVLSQLIGLVEEREVDVVLIAGDVYDRSVPPSDAVQLLDDVIDAINGRLGVPVIMIAGNHDGPARLSFGARQLAGSGVHIRGPLNRDPEPVVLQDDHGDVAFYALPYADPATVRDVYEVDVRSHEEAIELLAAQIEEHNGSDRRCVVLSHCFLDGGDVSDSERPLSIGGADRVAPRHFEGFSYAALGHLHGPQYKGSQHVRYSGSILKYSFSEEKQKKSVTLVDLAADGSCSLEKIPLVALRDMRVIEGELEEVLEAGSRDPHRDDYVLVRLLDTHAILDVMGKLREIYPNVLHLERPALAVGGERRSLDPNDLRHGHMPMFRDFYEQMTNQDLSEAGEGRVAAILDDINRQAG